jgi:YD repeat-containing protein
VQTNTGHNSNSNSTERFFISGTNNFFILQDEKDYYNLQGQPVTVDDEIKWYYIDELGNWKSELLTSTEGFNTGIDDAVYWYCNNQFAVAMIQGQGERIYRWNWNENLLNFDFFWQSVSPMSDYSRVFINGSLITIVNYDNSNSRLFRFDGLNWQEFITGGSANKGFSASYDFTVAFGAPNIFEVNRYVFDPNTPGYSPVDYFNIPGFFGDLLAVASYNFYGVLPWLDGNYPSYIFLRQPSGAWQQFGFTPPNPVPYKFAAGISFFVFTEPGLQTKFGYVKNGTFSGSVQVLNGENFSFIDGIQNPQLVSANTFVTHNSSSFENSNQLILHRVVDDAFSGPQTDYPATSITTFDGYNTTYSYFVYNTSTATYDPTGTVAQYNEVEVIPGTTDSNPNDGITKIYGSTKHFFFNGLPYDELDPNNTYPPNEFLITNARDYYYLLKGLTYATKAYKQNGTELSSTTNYWYVFTKPLGIKDQGTYARLGKTATTQDGIQTARSFIYGSVNGLVQYLTETNTDGAVRATRMIYAFENYSAMNSANMLSQVAQQTTYISSITPSNARSSSVTTWKDWGSGKWAPVKTYSWIEDTVGVYTLPTFNFTGWADATEPSGADALEWLRTSKVRLRDTYGQVTEAEDANGTVATTKWQGNKFVSPLASFVNATNAQTFNDDFQDGDATDWARYNGTWVTGVTTDDGLRGKVLHVFNNDGVNQINYRVVVTGGLNKGVVEYDIKLGQTDRNVDNNFKDVNNAIGPWIRWTQYGNLGYYAPGTTFTYLSFNYVANKWYHVRIEFDSSIDKYDLYIDGAKIGSALNYSVSCGNIHLVGYQCFSNPANAYVDNVRFYPSGVLATSTNYDLSTGLVVSTSDENGVSTFPRYDSFQRPIQSLIHDGKILSQTSYFYSRDKVGGGDVFSPTDPNSVSSITYPSETGYSDFTSSTGWTYSGDITFNVLLDKQTTVRMGTATGGWDNIYKAAGSGDVVARVDFYPDATTAGTPHVLAFQTESPENRICIQYLYSTDKFRIQQQINGGGWTYPYTFSLAAPQDKWYTAEIIKTASGRCYAWVYPKGAGRNYADMYSGSGFPVNWNAVVRSWSNDDYYYLANHYVGSFLHSTTYLDGLGRNFQSQSWDGEYDVISKSTFNSIGKTDKEYQPKRLSNTAHGFYTGAGFVEYEQFEYFDDPLARIKKQTHSGGGNWVDYAYTPVLESFNGLTYRYDKVTDETGKISKSYFDKLGNAVGGLDGVGTTDQIQWVNDYDILGNITTVKPPNFFNPPPNTSQGDWDSQNIYNTLGQTTQQTSPDEGTAKFIYDKNGNVRYTQDAHQADPARAVNDFTVTYYDQHNRVTLVGEENDDFNWTTTLPDITNTTYGTEAGEWKVKNYYDVNYVTGVANYCQGRLTKTEVNNGGTIHTILYVYDRFGNITQKRITIDGGSPITEKVISHSYDHLGRETQLTYPSGNIIARSYDALGRLKKIFTIN